MKRITLISLFVYSLTNAQWEHVPEVPATRFVYSLLAVRDTLYAGTDSVVYVGANGGTEWSWGVRPAAGPDIVGCMLKAGRTFLAGTLHNGVFKSTDDGRSWQPFSSGLSGLGATDISSLLVRRDSLIAGTLGAGVFATAGDFAHPWNSLGDSLADYQGDDVFKMLVVGNTVLAGAGSNGYVFRFTDAQPWWNPVPLSTPRPLGLPLLCMAGGATAVVAGSGAGVYKSTDEGLAWERTGVTIPLLTNAMSLVYHGSTFFALISTPLSSLWLMSSDQGETWGSLGEFPISNMFATAIVGETMYMGGEHGLWRAPLSWLLTGVGETSGLPVPFTLEQNYPNPFNPATTIRYALPHASQVTLAVYNTLGQMVASLVNEVQQMGYHEVRFENPGLASGVYFYRLQAGGFVAGRKLLLLK